MAVAQGSKPVKKAAAPKKSKASPSHPPYIEMITEALVSLKERTGSSHYAIAKHIEEQQKVRDLPPNFKKLLSVQLKKFVASGKLVKVKNSFKLPPLAAKKSQATTDAPKPKPKEVTENKRKKTDAPKASTKTAAKPKAKTAPAKREKTVKKATTTKAPAKKAAAATVASGAAKKKATAVVVKKPKSIKSPAKKTKSIKSPAKKVAKKAKK